MTKVVPLNDEALTPEFILRDALDSGDIKAVAVITLDEDGYCFARWSCPKQTDLCTLLVKLQAVVQQAVLE